jgi:hypothetical protein
MGKHHDNFPGGQQEMPKPEQIPEINHLQRSQKPTNTG